MIELLRNQYLLDLFQSQIQEDYKYFFLLMCPHVPWKIRWRRKCFLAFAHLNVLLQLFRWSLLSRHVRFCHSLSLNILSRKQRTFTFFISLLYFVKLCQDDSCIADSLQMQPVHITEHQVCKNKGYENPIWHNTHWKI